MEFRLLEPNLLKEHEEVDPKRLHELMADICKNRYVKAIVVDSKSMVILDGHHRYNVLKKLNARYVPVLLVDYNDSNIQLSYWREDYKNITKNDVLLAGNSQKKFPHKTSRHIFPFKNDSDVGLNLLL